MGEVDEGSRESVVRFTAQPLVLLLVTVTFTLVMHSWAVVILWGPLVVLMMAVMWHPFRLATVGGVPQVEYRKWCRWSRLAVSEIDSLRYSHAPLDLRGLAYVRVVLVDGRTVRIPGTAGKYWFNRAPVLTGDPIPRRALHLVRTTDMLRLVEQRLGIEVDTFDAVSMNPRR